MGSIQTHKRINELSEEHDAERQGKRAMKTYEFGKSEYPTILIQPVDDHDIAVLDSEVAAIREMKGGFLSPYSGKGE